MMQIIGVKQLANKQACGPVDLIDVWTLVEFGEVHA